MTIHKDHNCGLNTYVDLLEVDWSGDENDKDNEEDEDENDENGDDPTKFNLYITMTDYWGDGWNGNVLGLKQNNEFVG